MEIHALSLKSKPCTKPREVLLIRIAPVSASPPGYFRATLEGDGELLLCAASRQPFLDACRVLVQKGFPLTATAVMRRYGSNFDSLRRPLWRAAKMTSVERCDEPPRFAIWKPMPDRAGSAWSPPGGAA